MDYFTSDLHFFHKNIIRYCDRPFVRPDGQSDVDLMNETIISRWNERVKPEDTVRVVGDVTLVDSVARIKPLIDRLNGTKILIKGNHDQSNKKCYAMGFHKVMNWEDVTIDGKRLFIIHEPIYTFDSAHPFRTTRVAELLKFPIKYDYHLCGHIHEQWTRIGDIINVGVDVWDFYPRTLAELIAVPETPIEKRCQKPRV